MAVNRISVTPTCRYAHGELTLVIPERNSDGVVMHWGYVAAKNSSIVFEGDLYICTACGYTEFFDSDPNLTLLNNEVNGGYNAGS
jgi:hypothetical protein